MEGAMALASLPPTIQPAEELTPYARMERAKQAERAHLLQICMELGVEIYDVRTTFCFLVRARLIIWSPSPPQIAPDGHCMYAAVADQLHILKVLKEEDVCPRCLSHSPFALAHPAPSPPSTE